jgi:tetratricopeptide (TPR) repeat protein
LLTGRIALDAGHDIPANMMIPPRLAAIIRRALHDDPNERFDTASALADALRACRWTEEVADALIELALGTYQAGGSDADLIRACALIDQALAVVPGSAKAHQARGLIYFRNQSYSFAIHEFKKAASVAPNREVCHLLGQVHERQQQHPEAIAAYRAALAFGEDPLIMDHLARLLKEAGRPSEAVQHLRRAAELEADESIRRRRQALAERWIAEGSLTPDTTRG